MEWVLNNIRELLINFKHKIAIVAILENIQNFCKLILRSQMTSYFIFIINYSSQKEENAG